MLPFFLKLIMNNKNSIFFFISIVLLQILITFYSQNFILTDDLYRLVVGSQMTDRQFQSYLEFIHKWQWMSYLFVPLSLFFRISYTYICLKAGSYIFERFTKTSFLEICIQAEIVFTVGSFAGLLYTEFFANAQTIKQLYVNPFSLLIFFSESVPKWTNYFFNTLNIFEFGYVLLLAYIIAKKSENSTISSLKFVSSTYLPGLALWVLLLSYLSVVFQP